MKRFLTAIFLSLSFVVIGFVCLFPVSAEKEDVLQALLNLPAPPPPNPLTEAPRNRSKDFFDKMHPPADDAPIEDLLDYWREQSSHYQRVGYNIFPSDRSLQRILAEVRRDPSTLSGLLQILPDSKETADLVKEIYDGQAGGSELDHSQKKDIKTWLTYHTPYFSSDLARSAEKAGDNREYVNNQEELLSLAAVDWESARPMVDRLYTSSRSPSGVLAKWALYSHALLNDDLSEIDRYRDELKAVVEDKTATPGMRDLAFDALVKEKDWSGRDEWYYSLLEDETLADLRVNGTSYTGLTTIIMYSPPDKYADKMIELTNSRNIVVRSAAARNLLLVLDANHPDIARALLPWLENPKWARDIQNARQKLVGIFGQLKMPESVPGLIAVLDEKEKREVPVGSDTAAANTMSSTRYVTGSAVNSAGVPVNSSSASNTASIKTRTVIDYPLRYQAISALETQRDSRAVPALRRILTETQSYEAISVIRALIYSHGFTTTEEVDALESYLTSSSRSQPDISAVYGSNVATSVGGIATDYIRDTAATYGQPGRPPTPAEVKALLGQQMLAIERPDDELIAAMIERIKVLEQKDPALASMMKKVVLRWQGPAINAMALRDLKAGNAETETIVRLLVLRKTLRETQPNELADARSGDAIAVGITACLLEDANEYDAILSSQDTKAKTALLACGRLIRAPLRISRVAENLQSKDSLLATAAERYLESEDSPQARSIVLSLHPDEAKIMGATTCFKAANYSSMALIAIQGLFASVDRDFDSVAAYGLFGEATELEKTEKRLQKEVRENQDLLGIYSYDDNLIRIYKDKAVYVWEQDPSRYRERTLTKEEFQDLTSLLSRDHVDEMAPFLSCYNDCTAHELLMIGRQGGRRVFFKTTNPPQFLREIEKIFADMRREPSEQKYHLSKDIPGLEILFADDNFEAVTLWKNGADLRVLAGAAARREKVDREMEDIEDATEGEKGEEYEEKIVKLREQKELENLSWFALEKNRLAAPAAQPPEVEYIPHRDALAVASTSEQWKARAGNIEVRADSAGLYKVSGGRLVKIQSGAYSSPVTTANGRWVVALKYSDDGGRTLVRVNLLTNKEYGFNGEEFSYGTPIAYVASQNKVLVSLTENEEDGEDGEASGDREDVLPANDQLILADPETGNFQEAKGEFRPIGQQTFRPLQPVSSAPSEFWSAVPDLEKRETSVGIYNARTFTFRPLLKIPKMTFGSMKMWVDETEKKVYFIYRGQVLALPIAK